MNIKSAVKAALLVALLTFGAQLIVLATGWLADLAKWSSSSGHAPLPGLSVIGYAVLAAATSAASGFLTFLGGLIVKALQNSGMNLPFLKISR